MNNKIMELSNVEIDKNLDKFLDICDTGEEFENFLVYFFKKVGLDEIELTQYVKDGGIDLKGKKYGFDINGRDAVNYYIQAKRYGKSTRKVNVNEIRQLRGILPSGYIGIMVTTNSFTKDALQEAKKEGMESIICIDGKRLIQMCMDNSIIFKYKPYLDKLSLENIIKDNISIKSNNYKRDTVYKKITRNDARARILSIPSEIFNQLDQTRKSYKVKINGEELKLNIRYDRRFFSGITSIYKKLNIIQDIDGKDRVLNETDSYWTYNKENIIVEINPVKK